MTTQIAPTPVFKAWDNQGLPLAGGKLFTYLAGTTTKQASFTDSTGGTPNTNPVILNYRGEANVWLDPTKVYKAVLAPANDTDPPTNPFWTVDQISGGILSPTGSVIPTVDNVFTLGSTSFSWANVYVGPNHAPVFDTVSGNIGYYARTASEIAAGVTPTNFSYAPGIIDRYGTNAAPGTTNMNAAFAASLAQQQAGGAPMQLLAEVYLVTTNAIKTGGAGGNVKPLNVFGVPFQSCIINKAPANTPTIQLIGQVNFQISGICFAGRQTFPNMAIDLTSGTPAGTRTAFGKISDCLLTPNGVGIHVCGVNDLILDNLNYWGNGGGGFPGAPTFDTNGLPAAILSDTAGLAGLNPGQSNAVYIRNLQVGALNDVAHGGAGVKVDGTLNSLSTDPLAVTASQDWQIESYDTGGAARTVWMRFVIASSLKNIYNGGEIRFDNACSGITCEAIFNNSIAVDGTQALGGCERMTYIGCYGGNILATAGNDMSTHINNFWSGGDTDASTNKRILGGRVIAGSRTTDAIGGNGLCLGPAGAAQLVGGSGAGQTITTAGSTILRLNPAGACTATILAKPVTPTATLDGCTVKVINLSAFSVTMAAAGTSFVADGVACVIPALREMDFTFDTTSNLWYHT